jgi:organic hydroperoxide reductase OsmC/OhrA
MEREVAQILVDEAHPICRYSKATRNKMEFVIKARDQEGTD